MIRCTTVGREPSKLCYEICVIAAKCGALKAYEKEQTMSEKIYRVQMNSKGMPNFSTAEEIIRCRECKWFDSKGHCMRLTAEYGTYEDVRTDDFCSYGKRNE